MSLPDMKKLEGLSVGGPLVTDAGVAHLKRCTGIEHLDLDGSQMTDAGPAHLENLTQMVYLSLKDTQVNDAGLVHFLSLVGTRMTFTALKELQRARFFSTVIE